MICTEIRSTVELSQGVQLTHLRSPLVQDDSHAHQCSVSVVRDGSAVDLDGVLITGAFVRGDGITVPLTGNAENNTAIVTLPPECYREEGRCVMAIKATLDAETVTLFLAEGVVMRASTASYVADEETTLSLEELFRRLDAAVVSVEASASLAAKAADDAQVAIGGAEAVFRAEAAAEAAEAILARLEGINVTALVQEIDTLRAATTPTRLWTADTEDGWASGSVTVDGIADWYLVDIETGLGHAVGINTGTTITASLVTRYGDTANSQRTTNILLNASGDELTLVSVLTLRHKTDAEHGTIGTTSIKSITGLIKRGVSA